VQCSVAREGVFYLGGPCILRALFMHAVLLYVAQGCAERGRSVPHCVMARRRVPVRPWLPMYSLRRLWSTLCNSALDHCQMKR
jgi:hypothetical protein